MLLGSSIAVVVPAFDEERAIEETLAGIPAWVDRVVVVDDASRDGTFARASSACDPRVHVLRHAHNRGVGASLVTGYRFALALGADVIAVMAGDGQMDPADLERVVSPVARGEAAYIKGTRLHSLAFLGQMPLARAAATAVLGALTSLATGVTPITDGQCGFTAISSAALARLESTLAEEGLAPSGRGLDALWPRYGYPNDLLGAVARAQMTVLEVPVRPVYKGEESGIRAHHVLLIAWLIARAALRRRRTPGPEAARPAPARRDPAERGAAELRP